MVNVSLTMPRSSERVKMHFLHCGEELPHMRKAADPGPVTGVETPL